MKTRLLFIALAFSLATPAFAQRSLESPLPPTGNVTLSLDEYNRLLALANRPGKKSDLPPLPYILKRADLKFRVSNDDVLGQLKKDLEAMDSNTASVDPTASKGICNGECSSYAAPRNPNSPLLKVIDLRHFR